MSDKKPCDYCGGSGVCPECHGECWDATLVISPKSEAIRAGEKAVSKARQPSEAAEKLLADIEAEALTVTWLDRRDVLRWIDEALAAASKEAEDETQYLTDCWQRELERREKAEAELAEAVGLISDAALYVDGHAVSVEDDLKEFLANHRGKVMSDGTPNEIESAEPSVESFERQIMRLKAELREAEDEIQRLADCWQQAQDRAEDAEAKLKEARRECEEKCERLAMRCAKQRVSILDERRRVRKKIHAMRYAQTDADRSRTLRKDAEAALAEAVEALRNIKNNLGHVCDEYELCDHTSCAPSHRAWELANAVLAKHGGDK